MALSLAKSIPPGSAMPPGGTPRDDEAFMEWLSEFCSAINTRWLDLHYPHLPHRELLPTWQLLYHLHKYLIGWAWPEGTGPSRAHRIRFTAIQFRLRGPELISESRRYARQLYDEAIRDGGGTRDE